MALHSHTDELYNRANVLPRIGFDTVAFREDFMTEGAEDGAYLSDASLVQEMIARYESRDPSKPIFLYGLSMENHQLYTAEKYSYPSGIDVQCDKLSQEDKAILDSLVLGLHMLQRAGVPLNQYFTWLADHAANQMLLSRNRFFADENGVGSYTTTPEQAAMLETYTAMERNLLYNR